MPVAFYYIYPKHLAGQGNQCFHFSNFLPPHFPTDAVIWVPIADAFEIVQSQAAHFSAWGDLSVPVEVSPTGRVEFSCFSKRGC